LTGFHHVSSFDAKRAVNQLDQDRQALAAMTGAESLRIDELVNNVGEIKGQVSAVSTKVEGVATGLDKLNTHMAALVKFQIQVENTHLAQESARSTQSAHDMRIQALERRVEPLVDMKLGERVPTLEKQIGPLLELRAWVIGGGLFCLTLIGLALAKLIFK
jgi:chromosome segregation ATPase